jgi:hypothetical protein
MKKLFVSVPMRGRTEQEIKESIEKMKKVAEIYEGEELELIDTYIEDNPPQNNNQGIWYLGESLKRMAEADVFIGIDDHWSWAGCNIETQTAGKYGIKVYLVQSENVIPNYAELIRQNFVPVQPKSN